MRLVWAERRLRGGILFHDPKPWSTTANQRVWCKRMAGGKRSDCFYELYESADSRDVTMSSAVRQLSDRGWDRKLVKSEWRFEPVFVFNTGALSLVP